MDDELELDPPPEELLEACVECGGDTGAAPHDPQCMTGQLEDIENTAGRLRRCIADNSRPPFDDVAELLCRRMRACIIQLESHLAPRACEACGATTAVVVWADGSRFCAHGGQCAARQDAQRLQAGRL